MEIDLSELKSKTILLPLVLAGLVLLGWLGRSILPDDRVLTWTEWLVFTQRRVYTHELSILARDADKLAELLNHPPDPVRAMLVVEGISKDVKALTVAGLEEAAERLLDAADAVERWSLGNEDEDFAMDALEIAQDTISRAMERSDDGNDG